MEQTEKCVQIWSKKKKTLQTWT